MSEAVEEHGVAAEGAAEVGHAGGTARVKGRLLPAQPLWADPVADTRAPRSSLTVRALGTPAIDATVALPVPLVQLSVGDVHAQVGLAAAVFLGFVGDGPLVFDFETFDGWFALPIDMSVGHWSARLEWAHLSAHYGDGVRDNALRPGNFDPYSREWVRLWGARAIGPARVYASAWALLHALPAAEPFGVSGGAEAEGPWPIAPYAAVDLRLAQEDTWAPALTGQAGARIVTGTHRLRLGLSARVGPEDTGKLQPRDEAWAGVTLSYDRVAAD
ncbi:MAG: DUF1207 domain-containing protein [Pseudomonadota bacterium]|nr:DUF1207 domain-containing protein [Pseudomonadota bacterium]